MANPTIKQPDNAGMTLNLKNSSLLKNQAYLNGKWVDSTSRQSLTVTNPVDESVVGSVPDMEHTQIVEAVEAAQAAFKDWSDRLAKERAKIIRKWADLMMENQEDLARIMTAEQGKPLKESRGEIAYAAAFLEWFAEEGKRAYGDVIPSHIKDGRILVQKQPVGVCATITPWNFPSAMITRKVGPALAAGCTVVSRPASETPLSAIALAVLAEEAGVPPGVFNVVTSSDSKMVGKEFCENPIVKKLSFTGSTEVGRILMAQCAEGIKKVSLELGGNAPFIVFDDADIDAAVDGAIACKYRNAGQTCVCANRIYVQEDIYDEFTKKFIAKVKQMKVGDGIEESTDIGPMINDDAVSKVKDFMKDALEKGAKVETGGEPDEKGGRFFQATILSNVTTDMKVGCQEIFGPVAPLFKFKDEADVIAKANDTIFGLASYFYANDLGRVWRVAEALEYGMVAINTGILSTEVAPFGGVKQSGIGREGSKYGLDEYLEIKYVLMGGI